MYRLQAFVSLGATSIVQGRTALADRSVVLPKGFMNTMPVSVQTLARQHGVSTLDAITDAFTTVSATRHGVPFVRPTIEPTNTITLYERRIPAIASHVFLNLLRALRKRTMRKPTGMASLSSESVAPTVALSTRDSFVGDVGSSLPTSRPRLS